MDRWMTQFDDPVTTGDGRSYTARAWGRPQPDGGWTGWLEFEPREAGPLVRDPAAVPMETRSDFERWAGGIGAADLEVALERAIDRHRRARDSVPADPAPGARRPHGGVDPFAAYGAGEGALREALAAAEERQLRAVIRGHHWIDEQELNLERIGRPVLEEMIVAAVRRHAAARAAA